MDARLRELERRAALGDPQARSALRRGRRRAGWRRPKVVHFRLGNTGLAACGMVFEVLGGTMDKDRDAVTCSNCRRTRAFRRRPAPEARIHYALRPRSSSVRRVRACHRALTASPGEGATTEWRDVTCKNCKSSRGVR